MARTIRLSYVALLAGAALLAAAFAQPAHGRRITDSERRGGTLRLSRYTDVDSIDPALAVFSDSWMLEYATCAKLFNYRDAAGTEGTRVVPEVAVGFPVISQDG